MTTAKSLGIQSASDLVGIVLPGGWKIVELLARPGEIGAEDLTGSFFSFGYIAANQNRKAFLKVIDVERALADDGHSTLMQRLKRLANGHDFECSILDVCARAKLDRVVQILAKGEIAPPADSPLGIPIPYILFEHAEGGDVRKIVSRTAKLEDAWRLEVLHEVAVGIQQLHGQQIAHQDLKPSNVLLFGTEGKRAKIGDLGRASRKGMDAEHDSFDIAGAKRYAPPEQVYGVFPESWGDRRESCDLYHLGALTIFLFTGWNITNYYVANVGKEILPRAWLGSGGDYKTALPVLMKTLTNFVDEIRNDLPEWASAELSQIILTACNPDYLKRGDPGARQRVGSPIGIDTYVSRFDRLSKRAMVEVRR